jgi:hypothetical protein
MRIPKWSVLYDFHTMPSFPEVGKDFDCDAVAEQLSRCGVDFVVFPARCNLGNAYYDTKLGIRHPSLQFDLLRRMIEALHKRGIMISAYLNVGLSHEEGLLHREWTVISPEGYSYIPPLENHFFRQMCYNSGYAGHLLGMIDELLEYPLDGFFFDCFTPHPCIGVECIREMKKLGMEQNEFARFSRQRLAEKINARIKGAGREYLLYFNGLRFDEQLDMATYLEYECLPTGGWGYETLQLYARYLRTMKLPVLNMTGRFHKSWGDFGGIRTRASLLYDGVSGLSNAMGTNIGDHFHPRGDLNMAVYDLIADVYGELQGLQEWLDGARAVTDIALLISPETNDNTLDTVPFIHLAWGYTRLLAEAKQQFDVLTPDFDFSKYRILVLTDQIRLDAELAARIRDFIEKGGKVISCGHAGLRRDTDTFALPELWGAECLGESPHHPAYFRPSDKIDGFPEMPVALYEPGISLKATTAASGAVIIKPYFNRHFDYEHAYLYLPPDQPDGTDALTINEHVAHFSHPVGISYYKHAQVPLRVFMESVIRRFLPDPLLRVKNLPSYGRATVTEQPGHRIVWLTAFVPERRGAKVDMIEEGSEVHNLEIALRADAGDISRVYTAPGRIPLEFKMENGYCHVQLPEMTGYAVIVLEEF